MTASGVVGAVSGHGADLLILGDLVQQARQDRAVAASVRMALCGRDDAFSCTDQRPDTFALHVWPHMTPLQSRELVIPFSEFMQGRTSTNDYLYLVCKSTCHTIQTCIDTCLARHLGHAASRRGFFISVSFDAEIP
jgi:hypothetical protein